MASRPDVFVIARSENARMRDNPLAGTACITLPQGTRTGAPAIDVFASDGRRVTSCYDEPADIAVYLWGRALHGSITSEASLVRWIAETARESSPMRLREVLGHFIVILDDRRSGQITFISDVLGIRPWYVGAFGGRLVAGSNVLDICAAGLSNNRVDYDAVACWLKHNHEFTGGSVVEDYKAVPPGAVSTFDRAGNLISHVPYALPKFGNLKADPDELLEELHAEVTRTFNLLARDVGELNLPLSGGFDSRYVAAMVARRAGLKFHPTTIRVSRNEALPARRVAEGLKLDLKWIPVQRHILDLYDDPFAFCSAGFPTGRNLTSAVARLHPGMPLISGYMGDSMIRCSMTNGGRKFYGKDEEAGATEEEIARTVFEKFTLLTNRIDLLNDDVQANVNMRAMSCIRRNVAAGYAVGRPVKFVDLYFRQRLHWSQIFLQHLETAEAMLPFYSWNLVNLRACVAYSSYRPDNHQRIFEQYFPEVANIPHSLLMEKTGGKAPARTPKHARRPTRHIRAWSMELLRSLTAPSSSDLLAGVCRRRAMMVLPTGLLVEPTRQNEIMFLRKLLAFEQRLRQCGVEIDWRRM